MENKIEIGNHVVFNGSEREVKDVHGEVLILDDGNCVSSDNVSLIPEQVIENTEAQPEVTTPETNEAKAALRQRIDDLSEEATAVEVIRLTKEVGIPGTDLPMTENGQDLDIERLKRHLYIEALSQHKIDPRICGECGQRIPE